MKIFKGTPADFVVAHQDVLPSLSGTLWLLGTRTLLGAPLRFLALVLPLCILCWTFLALFALS